MERATVTVITGGSDASSPSSVYAYLRTINPFINFRRWLLAQFVVWASIVATGAIVALVVAALG